MNRIYVLILLLFSSTWLCSFEISPPFIWRDYEPTTLYVHLNNQWKKRQLEEFDKDITPYLKSSYVPHLCISIAYDSVAGQRVESILDKAKFLLSVSLKKPAYFHPRFLSELTTIRQRCSRLVTFYQENSLSISDREEKFHFLKMEHNNLAINFINGEMIVSSPEIFIDKNNVPHRVIIDEDDSDFKNLNDIDLLTAFRNSFNTLSDPRKRKMYRELRNRALLKVEEQWKICIGKDVKLSEVACLDLTNKATLNNTYEATMAYLQAELSNVDCRDHWDIYVWICALLLENGVDAGDILQNVVSGEDKYPERLRQYAKNILDKSTISKK